MAIPPFVKGMETFLKEMEMSTKPKIKLIESSKTIMKEKEFIKFPESIKKKYDLYALDFDGVISLDDFINDTKKISDLFFLKALFTLLKKEGKKIAIVSFNISTRIIDFLTNFKLYDFIDVVITPDHEIFGLKIPKGGFPFSIEDRKRVGLVDKNSMIIHLEKTMKIGTMKIGKSKMILYDDSITNVLKASELGVDSVHINADIGFTFGVWELQTSNRIEKCNTLIPTTSPCIYEAGIMKQKQPKVVEETTKRKQKLEKSMNQSTQFLNRDEKTDIKQHIFNGFKKMELYKFYKE